MFYRFVMIVALIWSSLAVARPPASDVQGLYQNTRPDRQEYSPLWGMVALEGELLKGSRFYSDYSILSRDPETRNKQSRYTHPSVAIQLQRHNKSARDLFPNIGLNPKQLYSDSELLDIIQKNQPSYSKDQADFIATLKQPLDDFPKNAIAGWLQALFPSPHFLELSPNMRKFDHIGSLMTEPELGNLNSLIENMIQYREGRQERDLFIGTVTALFNKLGQTYKNSHKQEKISSGQFNAFKQKSSHLASLIADALDEEKTLANPKNPNQQIYPENIVMTALMAFIWERIDSAEPLYKLSSVMHHGTQPGHTQIWDRDAYTQFKAEPLNINNYEKLAFMLSSYNTYDQIIPVFMTHKTVSTEDGPSFYNCGENSLMQFFWVMLNERGSFKKDYLEKVYTKLNSPELNAKQVKFKNFWSTTFNSWSQAGSQSVADKWATLVSGMNLQDDSIAIQYVQRSGKHEIVRGIYNMLNVMAHLLPDPELNQPWSTDPKEKSQQAKAKLDRLCKILSREGFEVNWRLKYFNFKDVPESGDITFKINGTDAFVWHLGMGHWELQNIPNSSKQSWKSTVNVNQLPNIWLQARFMDVIRQPQGVLALYSPNNRTVDGALQFTKANLTNSDIFPVLGRTLIKAIPLDDAGPRRQLVELMTKYRQSPFFANYFPDLVPLNDLRELNMTILANLLPDLKEEQVRAYIREKFFVTAFDWPRLISYTITHGHMNLANDLLEYGHSLTGVGPLMQAALANQLRFMMYLETAYGTKITEVDSYNSTVLHRAIQGRSMNVFWHLMRTDLPTLINHQDRVGNTPLHVALNHSEQDPMFAQQLLERNARLDIKNKDGKYPLQLALEAGKLDLIDDLKKIIQSYPDYQLYAGSKLHVNLKRYNREQIGSFLNELRLRSTITNLSFEGGTLDDVLAICGMVENLQGLSVPGYKLGREGLQKIIAQHPQLVSLNVYDNSIETDDVSIISGMRNLRELNLGYNKIGAAGAQALSSLTNLTSLNLGNNNIGDAGAQALSSLINLTSLNLRSNKIGDAGAQALSSLTNLTSLVLEWNNISASGTQALSKLINLTSLNLLGSKIGDTGAQALSSLTNLTSLYLESNNIGDAEAQTLSKLINLTSLNLGSNKIGDAGAQALSSLTNLTSLNLAINKIGAVGAQALSTLPNLTSLSLSTNEIGTAGAQALSQQPNLTSLNLASNSIGAAGAQALSQQPNLTSLNLYDNNIGDAGAQALSSLINLTSLNLGNNSIGDAGAQALSQQPNLTSLNLGNNNIGVETKSLLRERFGNRVQF